MHDDQAIAQWKSSGSFFKTSKAGGLEVYIRQLGNPTAPPEKTLLLIHGFPESSFSYHLVVEDLSAFFDRVLLFDMPGYGLSDKPRTGYSYSLLEQADIALEVWEHFGVSGGHVIAHNMGNSVATELVAREVEGSLPSWLADGFKSYTFTNGSIVLQLAELRIIQKLLLTRAGKWISRLSSKRIFRHQVKSAHGAAPLDEIEIDRLWQMNIENDGRKVAHLTIKYILDRRRYEAKRWLPALQKTNVPVHLCWGDQDQVARVEMADYLKKKVCTSASLTIMEGVGHFCQTGSPKIWIESILPFYERWK